MSDNILFGDRVCVKIPNNPGIQYTGSINAKVLKEDLYVVSIKYSTDRLGNPNRHILLEWGYFTGSPTEHIIPLELIVKI